MAEENNAERERFDQFNEQMNNRRVIGQHAAFWRTCPMAQDPAFRLLIDEVEESERVILDHQQEVLELVAAIKAARELKKEPAQIEADAKDMLLPLEGAANRGEQMIRADVLLLGQIFREKQAEHEAREAQLDPPAP